MNTIKIESDKKYVVIPMEEYNRLKLIETEFEELNLSSEDEKMISDLEDKVSKGDLTEVIDYSVLRDSLKKD